jgi:hypothetical protein
MLAHKLTITETRQLPLWMLSISASLTGFCVADIGLIPMGMVELRCYYG